MNATSARVLYLAGARGFRSDRMSRKCAGIVNSIRAEGALVQVVSGGDLGPPPAAGVPLSQKVKPAFKSPLGSFLFYSVSEFRDILHDQRLGRMVEKAIADFRPTLIWERSSRLHTSGVRAAAAHRIPFVLEWVDNLTELYGHSLFKPLARAGERRKMSRADIIIVPSSKLAALLSAEWKISSDRFIVAINGVDPEEFLPRHSERLASRRDLGIPEGAFVTGYVGSYAWYQNVEVLIEAALHLARTDRIAGKLFLMVGDGPGRAACEALVERYALGTHFRFMGAQPQSTIPELLGACDAAALPDCLDIICPIKVQEYLSMGLAVLVPDYEANREVVRNNETGLCFSPKDPVDLANNIDVVASDAILAGKLRSNARLSAIAHFTWEKTWGAAFKSITANL